MCGWREARRIYVTGGPCSGVSTLGRAVAARLDLRLVDVEALAPGGDDPAPDAAARLRTCLGASGWLLCGPAEGWGDAILRDCDRILYLLAGSQTRLARRIATDRAAHGDRIDEGGALHGWHLRRRFHCILYDDARFTGPTRRGQEDWLLRQGAPVYRLNGNLPLPRLLRRLFSGIEPGCPGGRLMDVRGDGAASTCASEPEFLFFHMRLSHIQLVKPAYWRDKNGGTRRKAAPQGK